MLPVNQLLDLFLCCSGGQESHFCLSSLRTCVIYSLFFLDELCPLLENLVGTPVVVNKAHAQGTSLDHQWPYFLLRCEMFRYSFFECSHNVQNPVI